MQEFFDHFDVTPGKTRDACPGERSGITPGLSLSRTKDAFFLEKDAESFSIQE